MTERPHRTVVELDYPDERTAQLVARSLRQEVGEIDDDRSTTDLARRGATVALTIEAADLVALRAAANSWLSLVEVAERVAATAASHAG